MKKSIVILLLISVNHLFGQDLGIHFEKGLSWEEIQAKARSEHKGIFIDCYATWCGPCKKMDKEVYTDSLIGNYINSRYVSVKMQMDSTGKDDEDVKSWYNTVREFKRNYNFNGFPSYLFFSENIELLHRAIGYKRTVDFINLAEDAQNPAKQYFKRILAFKAGHLKLEELPELSHQAGIIGDKMLSQEIGTYYKIHYLDTVSEQVLLSKKNVEFLTSNLDLVNSRDRFFSYCLKHIDKFDSLHRQGAKNLVNEVITREEITDRLMRHDTILTLHPNWNSMYASISKKYGKFYADNLLPDPQRLFYSRIHDWNSYAKVVDDYISKFPLKAGDAKYSWDLNNYAWEMFLLCKDRKVLLKALAWSNSSISSMGDSYSDVHNFYDTRANLQYKLGMPQKAIQDEKKAIDIATQFKSHLMSAYKETKSKMESGVPTWD